MAQPTTSSPTASHPPAQSPTHGIGTTGTPTAAAAPTPLGPVEPVLLPDIDPVLLVRCYPDAKTSDDARSLAMKAGKERLADGEKIQASQQEPIVVPPA